MGDFLGGGERHKIRFSEKRRRRAGNAEEVGRRGWVTAKGGRTRRRGRQLGEKKGAMGGVERLVTMGARSLYNVEWVNEGRV